MNASFPKLTIVLPSTSRTGGGVSEAARLFALAAREHGYDIRAVTLENRFTAEDRPAWDGIPITTHKVIGPRSFGFAPGMVRDMLRNNADLVHLHGLWMFPGWATAIWAAVRRKPYIISPHGMMDPWILKRSAFKKRLIGLLFQNRLLRGTAAMHVLTEREATDLRAAADSPVEVVPNCVEKANTTAGKPDWWSPEMDGRTIYMFFGRIHEKKSCVELCDAWDQLCAADPDFAARSQLIFCGWVDALDGFADRVATLGNKHGNALFAGPQFGEQKAASLGVADFFLLPSKSEGLPMSVLEAWAYGIPVLMSKECNLQVGFDRGAALDVGMTTEDISKGLARAAQLTDAERQAMSANGRRLQEDVFSRTAVGTALDALYRRALSP